MTAHLEAPAEILSRIRIALEEADEPQQVLHAVVAELRACYPLARAAIRRVDDPMLEIVAVWSLTPTALGPGTRMSVTSSSLPTILTTGRPVIVSGVDAGGLLDDIVTAEGISSYVTLPLHVHGLVKGLLSFSSGLPEAFKPDDLPFLERVAEAVETRADVLSLG